ncbi:ion transporter [Myxococcota bacterium]|nr:ion transporter [Myxococcota bacterium]MCZ7617971.1 potassium channel family protein [Myxococcota bacterium]
MADQATSEQAAAPLYQVFMLALCIFAILALGMQTTADLTPESAIVLQYADFAICVVFFVDFLYCLWRAPSRTHYFLTWGWLDLLSSIPMLEIARVGRVARIFRIFRVLRGLRASRLLAQLILERRAESTFLAASLVALLLLVVASASVLQFEIGHESNIRTAEDAVWWAFVTITTVGYGDRFPVTPEGRVVAGFLMAAEVGLFGTLSGLLASWFLRPATARETSERDALREEVALLRAAVEALHKNKGPWS